MSTFVLVHGSFHGGWCWEKVRPLLQEDGHSVHAPTLTGLGNRSHLTGPQVGLALHVRDVVQYLQYGDLREIVLVGHSYGGLVITGVAEACADRIAHLVYLDGFLPEHGQSAWDINAGSRRRWKEKAEDAGFGWFMPPPDPEEAYEISDPDDAEWVRTNLVPMPLLTHDQPVWLPDDRSRDLPRTYIACTRYETFRHMARKAREEGLDYHELDTGHDAMVTASGRLSAILVDAAKTVD